MHKICVVYRRKKGIDRYQHNEPEHTNTKDTGRGGKQARASNASIDTRNVNKITRREETKTIKKDKEEQRNKKQEQTETHRNTYTYTKRDKERQREREKTKTRMIKKKQTSIPSHDIFIAPYKGGRWDR